MPQSQISTCGRDTRLLINFYKLEQIYNLDVQPA